MEELFEKILAVDERAKKLAAGENHDSGNTDAEIAEKIESFKKKADEDFTETLSAEIDKYHKTAEKRIEELKKTVDEQKKRLSAQVDENHEKWIKEIMEEIVS